MVRLIPVEEDPFTTATPSASPRLEPVDFDPFAGKDVTRAGAPASGVFPATDSSGLATVPASTQLPQSSAPTPSPIPTSDRDPGVLSEAYGDTVKGLHSLKRGAFLTGYMTGAYDDVDNIARHMAASKTIEEAYPSSPTVRKANEELEKLKDSGAGGFLPSMGVYARNPRAALSTTVQSLPTALGSMVSVPVGAAVGSLAGPVGTGVGAVVGAGLGSAATDFGNALEDYARDKWKPQTEMDWKAILLDKTKMDEAGLYAAKHAGMVGTFDALGIKFGGKVGGKIVEKTIGSQLAKIPGKTGEAATIAATSVAGSPINASFGGAGEAAGEYLGGGKVDPTQVAGEVVGGVLADIPSTAIEPLAHATGVGAAKHTPATPQDILEAARHIAAVGLPTMPTPEPDAVSGSITLGDATPNFYSPARRYIEEKGPGAATAEQWENTLRNATGVKQEELVDAGLDKFLVDSPGKLTKRQLLDHLDENAIRLEETHRTNDSPTDKTAQFEGYTLPGERGGYTELNMHLPMQDTLKEVKTPRGWGTGPNEDIGVQRVGNQDQLGGHYPEPNTVVHMRVTDRMDVNGTPMALLEEIQSDWHQQGRKRGYAGDEMTDPTFMDSIDERIGQHLDQTGDRDSPLYHAFTGTESGDALMFARRAGLISQEEEGRYRRDMKGTNPVAAGPFRQSWDELAFKRYLRWAVDKGYRRIAWVNSKEQMRRYPQHPVQPGGKERQAGMEQFYDRVIPSMAKKWAKRLGGTLGETQVGRGWTMSPETLPGGRVIYNISDEKGVLTGSTHTAEEAQRFIDERAPATTVQHIDIPQNGVDLVQNGLPLYSELNDPSKRKKGKVTLDDLATAPKYLEVGHALTNALQELVKGFGFTFDLNVVFHYGGVKVKLKDGRSKLYPNVLGLADYTNKTIHINPEAHTSAAAIWATMTHELGHFVMVYKYHSAPAEVKTAIRAAFEEFVANTPRNQNMDELINRRDNAVIAYENTRQFRPGQTLENTGKRKYWMHFEEWFAEQTARWATSTVKPLTTVEKFFKSVSESILKILEAATRKFGLSFEATPAVAGWLNSFHTDAQPFAEGVNTENEVKTQVTNQVQMEPEEKAVPVQPETLVAREGMEKLFNGRPPKEVKVAAAYADKFNKIYKYMMGIHQVAQRNPHILPLQEYTETIAVAQLTKQQIMIRAQEVLKGWNRLGGKQADAVTALIDDVQNMTYLTDEEVKNKVARFPTQAEIADLVKKHGVSQEGLIVFRSIADTFNEHLTRYEAVLRNEAKKITDPVKMAGRMIGITNQIKNLRSKPYFPAMRFGDYTITVRNSAKQVIHFETFEKERHRNGAADAIRAQYGIPKDQMELGKLDKQVKPLMGVPTQLLELMGEKLELSKKQRDALEQMKFELSPAQSFKHRFQHKRRIAGYSMDFRRAYANYFFHGANHLMKAMYADRLRGLTAQTRAETQGVYDVTTRHEIVAFMNDHLENWLDPKSDWAAVRAIAFIWQLAWTPAAAAQNLTQTLMTTYPFLAGQFGDIKAMGALMRTGGDFTSFYKTGTLKNSTEFELKALGRGIQDGLIKEAMAPELAGFAEGGNLRLGFGGNELQRGMQQFNEWGAKMFEMAEQTTRRLVFRATIKLANENPDAKYVKGMPLKHKLHFDQLRAEGWTEQEATAYVTARDATITTQFQYGREYAPRFMRGKARSIFVFKTFIQNYVLFLANYPGPAVRSLLIMGVLGGFMGVPGAEDLKEILKAIGWRMFGKDFDLEKEARRFIIQLLGEDETGRVAADMVMHGIARQGYGIPSFMDMIGGSIGVDIPMPKFDRSASISAGTLLPVELGKLFGPPTQDQDAVISNQAQKASGAVFGAGFNVYKALTNAKVDWKDSKRWERAVPRAIGNLAKSYRVGTEGRERTGTGSTLVKYDVRDTQQLMEVIGMGMGYTPYRQSLQWNRIMAGQEAVKLWDIRRTGLMKQMGNAVLGKDEKEIATMREAILKFNSSLPPEARGKAISGDTLRQSIGTQARSRAAQEAESSVKKSDIPILREVQKLYPESQATSVRRVPKALQ